MKTQKQGIILGTMVSLAGPANAQAQLVRTLTHFIRKSIHSTVALVTLGLFCTIATAATVDAIYNGPTDVPVTADSYTATGNTVNFTLNFTPATGMALTVVNNTGLGFINGTFDNLTNGQPVMLSYGGNNYKYVANYYGGSGNHLVLIWANQRAFAWGYNNYGQLGDNTTTTRLLPVLVTATGVLAGKTLMTLATGDSHSLALCSDGTVATWGYNNYGQLGDNTFTRRSVPLAVNAAAGVSALYGKTVVAIAAGQYHSLALCSDGAVVAWGANGGMLGDNTTTTRKVPVAVNTASGVSALYGKTVVAIAGGYQHSLALCSDGTVAAWGYNNYGQLGDSTTTQRNVPVAVNTASGVSALYGKTVAAIAAGQNHSLALCSDGTVVAWGYNYNGQLGDNTTTQRNVPVVVNTNSGVSALFGKTVMAIAAGTSHSLALCSDGTVVAWGYNNVGQLGDNTTTNRLAPVVVNTDAGVSALYSKTVAAIAAGANHSLALCADGTAVVWGFNYYGQLGDNTTMTRLVPVAVNTTVLATGELFTCVTSSSIANHTLALAAMPCLPAISLFGNGVPIINGAWKANSADGTEFGGVMPGGGTVVRTFTIQNTGLAPLNLTGSPRVAVSGPQAAHFTVMQQPASPVASLTGVETFQVTFAAGAMDTDIYTATLSITNDDAGQTPFTFAVRGAGAIALALAATYTTGHEVPLTRSGFTATGSTVNFTLNFAPPVGTELMVVNNTGLDFIHGTFDNLTNRQPVALSYGGVTYNFVADYYGGSGNDLVLVWANNRVLVWGRNSYGQLGDNTMTNRFLPVPVNTAGVLAGKTVLGIAAGWSHSIVLCSDGTLAAWGENTYGRLGDNTTVQRIVPVAVNMAAGISALYGKTVAAISAGGGYNLALCTDGTVAAWGDNSWGQLGDNTTTARYAPVAVNTAPGVSALYGKTVVAIAAGAKHSLALCSDGTLAAWGDNGHGEIGDNSTTQRKAPVAVNTASGLSALYGKAVVAITAGQDFSLALCSDGTVAAWGYNNYGLLGDNTTTTRIVPVAVNTASGVSALYGKTVVAIAAGDYHGLALCSDGTVAAWGNNNNAGQLGDNTETNRWAPVAVNTDSGVSALYGKTAVTISAGSVHSVAFCSDGTAAAWGHNGYGELGDNGASGPRSLVPVAVQTTPLAASQRFIHVTTGCEAVHTMALVAGPLAAEITLAGAQALKGCPFQFCFTNTPGAFFGVLASTNPALPLSNWTPLGDATEVSHGQFQFSDPQATNGPQRFYRVRSP